MITFSINTTLIHNHLGSAAYLTIQGQVTQTLNYLPYGEDWVEQNFFDHHDTTRLGIYRFNGKELDEETGYGYFGARYMDHELMTGWLSEDPMSDKYPSLSPYNYCAWNPIKLVDPDGEECNPVYDRMGNFLGTDNKGLEGNAYVMDKDNFSQGMDANKAKSLNLGVTGLVNKTACSKLLKHYNNRYNSKGVGVSIDLTFCPGVGGTIEVGAIRDQKGKSAPFTSISNHPSVGVELSVGVNVFCVSPRQESPLELKDYEGNGYSVVGSVGLGSVSFGGDSYSGAVYEKYNTNYRTYKLGIGIGIGASMSQTKTEMYSWESVIEGIVNIGQTYWK